jgi:hypothetical protein
MESNKKAVALIHAVLADKISDAREFSRQIQDLPAFHEESTVAEALDQARKFLADSNTRSKDPAYNQLQMESLKALVNDLRNQ